MNMMLINKVSPHFVIITFTFIFLLSFADDVSSSKSCTTPGPDLKPGLCIELKKCSYLVDLLQESRTITNLLYIMRATCYHENNAPVVCCSYDQMRKFPDSDTCGKSDSKRDRVVGGQPAELGAWPWMAALGYIYPQKSTIPQWQCAGALINDRFVVSAAHCLLNTTEIILKFVRLGELDFSSENDGASPIDIEVAKIIPHEKYDASTRTSDIGLIKLKKKVSFTKLVRPICLPFDGDVKARTFEGYSPFIAGWGSVSYGGRKSSQLLEAQVDVMELWSCKRIYKNFIETTIDSRVICAGMSGKDACKGDSGGPLMIPKGANYYLIGIVSYGYKCAEIGIPGVYTRVSEFIDWIDNNAY